MSEFGKSALVVEGGAMRSVFAAGVLDGFLQKQFNPFDFYIGVSGGAYNLVTYLAKTQGASLQTILDFALNKQFISYTRFFLGGNLLDLDWLFETVLSQSNLDLDLIYQDKKPFFICATDVHKGQAVYIETNPDNLIDALKASTALPYLYRSFPKINGRNMTDGGVADSIPVRQAMRMGASKIMVIRARPSTYMKKDSYAHRLIRWKLRKYPKLHASLQDRIEIYKDTLKILRDPPDGIKIVEVCPPETVNFARLNRSRLRLVHAYEKGTDIAEKSIQQWDL
jgi:predicted patatin/cPLA2 family phospholipase